MKPIQEGSPFCSPFFFAQVYQFIRQQQKSYYTSIKQVLLQEHFVSSIFFHLLAFFSVNTLNDLAAISPRPKTNATALILWIQTCLFYIVAAMAEYALLLTSRCWIPYVENKRYFGQLLRSTLNRLDKCMVILLPIVFFIHSFVFWKSVESYY